jgi:hypothetical protein
MAAGIARSPVPLPRSRGRGTAAGGGGARARDVGGTECGADSVRSRSRTVAHSTASRSPFPACRGGGTAEGVETCFVHGLGHGRVRENGGEELFFRRLQGHCDGVALDHFRDLRADHVGADQSARLRVEDRLHEAVRFAGRDRLAVHLEGEAADLDLAAGSLGALFGQADGGDLRLGVGAARDRSGDLGRL